MRLGERINRLLGLNANQAYFFHEGTWYHHLRRFPGVLIDRNGWLRFNSHQEYLESPHLAHGQRLHTTVGGISNIAGFTRFTPEELNALNLEILRIPSEETLRRRRETNSIIRDQGLVDHIKSLYQNTCQICDTRLEVGRERYYSEVHHIVPLGQPHNGPDTLNNMICVCPNHHAQLDYAYIRLNLSQMLVRHDLNIAYINHHNGRVS